MTHAPLAALPCTPVFTLTRTVDPLAVPVMPTLETNVPKRDPFAPKVTVEHVITREFAEGVLVMCADGTIDAEATRADVLAEITAINA